MSDFTVERCRTKACAKPIIWAETVPTRAGSKPERMPVDAEPVVGGNISLKREGGTVKAVVVSPKLSFGRRDLRMPHFATCPEGESWRKRQAAGKKRRRP